jgi:predicted DNA-binding protein with PD1-like motif
MHTFDLEHTDGRRTVAVIFDSGEEVIQGLTAMATDRHWGGSHFTAIGAFERVELAYFDWARKTYDRLPLDEQVEVLALTGDIAIDEQGRPKVHAHVVVGRRDGTTRGGHLMAGHVRPTLEVVLTESPVQLVRYPDPDSGLALIRAARPKRRSD